MKTERPRSTELMAAIEELRLRSTASGTMVDTGGLFPDARGARIKAAKGKLTVTDEVHGVERSDRRLCHPRSEVKAGSGRNR